MAYRVPVPKGRTVGYVALYGDGRPLLIDTDGSLLIFPSEEEAQAAVQADQGYEWRVCAEWCDIVSVARP